MGLEPITHNPQLACLAKWLSVCLRAKCLWVRVPLHPLWNLNKFRFYFWLWINYKNACFYDNAHFYICLICWRLNVSSLTKIQYLQIEPSEKRTHTNENMMLKMFFLYGFVRWGNSIWWAIENTYLLFYKFFEFPVEWIPAIRNKTEQKLSSVQKSLTLLQLLIK